MRRPSAQPLTSLKNGSTLPVKLPQESTDSFPISYLKAAWKHWFLIGTALSIVFANVWPWVGSDDGPLYPKITVKYGAVVSIFFISGITMRTETMMECIKDYKMHLFIQSFSLVLSPLLVCTVLLPMLHSFGMSRPLIEGFIVVGCMPPPVSTSVILTKTAGGNEASAIFNSALGSFLGVVVTPIELLMLVDPFGGQGDGGALGGHSSISEGSDEKIALLTKIFVELSLTVVLPIIVGQILRPRLGDKVDTWKPQLSVFSSLTLLLIIYTTFCNTFCDGMCTQSDIRNPFASSLDTQATSSTPLVSGSRPSIVSMFHDHTSSRKLSALRGSTLATYQNEAKIVKPVSLKPFAESSKGGGVFGELSTNALIATCMIVVLIQLVLMVLAGGMAHSKRVQRLLKVEWSRPDVVSIIFSSVHKSLTLGVPVLKIVFASSPILPLLSLPLLMYHPIQIVIGGIAAPSIKQWVLLNQVLKSEPDINPVKMSVSPKKSLV